MNMFPKLFGQAVLLTVLCVASLSVRAQAIDIAAREYILLDFLTGAVLDSKQADERMPPSSMSKLMTAYMAFDAI